MRTQLHTFRAMLFRISGHINLLTMKKCISLKCINLFNFLARLLLTLEKCISLECIGSCFIFSHLLTYLGPLYQLKGVSATAEKRVLVTSRGAFSDYRLNYPTLAKRQ